LKDAQTKGISHGNWVSTRIILVPIVLTIIFSVLVLLSPYMLIPTGMSLLTLVYFIYARYLFSPRGRNIQAKVRSLVVDNLRWEGNGHALDIGCGSGALTIELAKRFASSVVVGADYWPLGWGYSEEICRQNAQLENVANRVSFVRATASALPFNDEEFDAVVSNLVFHEIRDTSNKVSLIKEALRVLKKGGKFSFQDLFGIKQYYGDSGELIDTLKKWGISKVEYIDTRQMPFIPTALKLPFMIGTLGLLTGEK
jgi:ubiquinone/menaquinone biosynthesis C-methylase UbiE